ncbi:hypothetical protein LTR78_002915 [Recurvomyces mirabilis]|uniref:Prenylcysteine lyase domain-containing protein n=1 Tax=Recurvomyces mirabilis TaxID=574656 RepID=A0AAE1C447_9PEZI|nr:hypothetical protein LTR78_002915 [Recurvomyces mirabilis]KAK5159351.1 hypothetical protein LTS14_002493 [Recurvomyces mirabilis]
MKFISHVALLAAAGRLIVRADEQVVLTSSEEQMLAPMNVAIIGAGAAGSSTAYHLARFATAADIAVNITVFDRNDYIGGRSTTVYAYNDSQYPVELGASIFVKVNTILTDAVAEFNLTTSGMISRTDDIPGADIGVWDGQNFVVEQNSGSLTWWDTTKFLWRYGLAPARTMNLMKSTTGKFFKMYEEPFFPFVSLTKTVRDLDLLSATSATGEEYLAINNIGSAFGHDIIQASTRVNYAQNLKYINGLLSMVCMATDGAVAVEGGNWQIFDHMVSAVNAHRVLDTPVSDIKSDHDGSYTLNFQRTSTEGRTQSLTQSFDAVVIAGPYQYANITLAQGIDHTPKKIKYVTLHVTLLTSPHLLSPAFFALQPGKAVPKTVLTTLSPDEAPQAGPAGVGRPGFFSISLLSPVPNPKTGGQDYLYKIFSPEAPDSTFLSSLLGLPKGSEAESPISEQDISWIYRKIWHSYPYEIPRTEFDHIQLHDDLWYTGGMESFISTMETNALMGKNVAKLIVDQKMDKLRMKRESYATDLPLVLASGAT